MTKNIFNKLIKLLRIVFLFDKRVFLSLFYGVAASVEHKNLLSKMSCQSVVDIGANRGQFALIARYCFPDAYIFSFEPLPTPADVFRRVFKKDINIFLCEAAIGPIRDKIPMHVSAKDDSSSLLPITQLQSTIFPGTQEVGLVDVQVAPLNEFITESKIAQPALLKLDVQGFEYQALLGCESLLSTFDWVYCECSFVELYSGQVLASDLIAWLSTSGFKMTGVYNPSYDLQGATVQADLLFSRVS